MAAEDRDLNRDPISDEPGAHPVATGVGAAGGAVAGAAAGMVGGPLGMAVGGVVGAVVGGLAGKAAGEAVNPTVEEAHWRDRYASEPYYEHGRSYDDYGPAYRYGWESRGRYDNWDAAEPELRSNWESQRGGSSLDWDRARPASRAAWDRVDTHFRGEGDLRNYGTGMASSDSSYRTGGPNDNYDGAGAYGIGGGEVDNRARAESTYDANRAAGMGTTGTTSASTGGAGSKGAAAAVGSMQSGGNNRGDAEDVRDVLEDLLEVCRDGEYGFRECAEQAKSPDLKSLFQQRAQDCQRAAQELQQHLRRHGGDVDEGGSAMGALHRGWVSVKATLSTYDDKAVLEEAERGEDNALARYRKAASKPLPQDCMEMIQRQLQGVQRNHDQVRQLRNQFRGAA